ncbi:MAG: gas vesicle protein GvpN [Planctomycetota bacterium]
MDGELVTILKPKPREGFVNTGRVEEVTARAQSYLEAGYPVHFSGASGTGKTSLALHLAARLGRPVILIHGDDEFGSSDLIGGNDGYHRSRIVDNFIHSVLKTEDDMKKQWIDNRLTTACRNGLTLVYDEFTRSRPEANNVLLSVLEERVLDLPHGSGDSYLRVHADFRAIFTSNPEEYAGVHKTQDALLDRMITIHLGHYDLPTEIAITMGRSGLDEEQARRIVRLVREIRQLGVRNYRPTIRACIMIARITRLKGAHAAASDPLFAHICKDILSIETIKVTHDGKTLVPEKVEECIHRICGAPLAAGGNGRGNGNGRRPCESVALVGAMSQEQD